MSRFMKISIRRQLVVNPIHDPLGQHIRIGISNNYCLIRLCFYVIAS